MQKEDKEVYLEMARKLDAQHKIKYPGKIISLNIQYAIIHLKIAK
jgi:hypothetical protein